MGRDGFICIKVNIYVLFCIYMEKMGYSLKKILIKIKNGMLNIDIFYCFW